MRKRRPTDQPLTHINNSSEGGRGAATLPAQVHSRRNSNNLNHDALDEALRCWAQRTGLGDADLGALRQLPFAFRTVDRDGYIAREGETPTSCSLIVSGSAFRQKMVRNGARQIVSFHLPGEFVDLQSCLLAVNDHGVQALGACTVAVVPRKALLSLIDERPSVALAMWFDAVVESSIFREWVVNVGRRNARARIAHLLCELAIRLGKSPADGDVYRLPLTQEHIADATGMTAVHTNRTIQGLRKDGLISMALGRLEVHDWNALRSIGDFSDLYLHRDSHRPLRG
jgi:CRP-like cAMP-binding protein